MIIYSEKIKKIIQAHLDGFIEGSIDRLAESIANKTDIPIKDICVFLLREREAKDVHLACMLNCGEAEPYTEDDWGLVYLFKRSKEADEREI